MQNYENYQPAGRGRLCAGIVWCTLCLWQIPNPATKHPFFITNDSKHICLCAKSKKKIVCQFFSAFFWRVGTGGKYSVGVGSKLLLKRLHCWNSFCEIATWHKGVWSTHRERLLLACTLQNPTKPHPNPFQGKLNRTEPRHNRPENDVATINVNIFTVVVGVVVGVDVVAVVVVVDVVVIYNVHNICGPGKHLKYNGGKLVSFSSCL